MISGHDTDKAAPIRCLVIQLARLGDTLQSLMALRAAKQLYPQLEIYFLAREKFSSAAQRIPWITKVITLPTDTLLGPLMRAEKTETQALGDLARWIAPLLKDPWDFIVNWTFSDASGYLAGLLPAKIRLGYTRRQDTTFAGTDGWSHYVQAIIQGRISQNIHLTDILTTQLLTALQIHAGEPLTDGNDTVTSKTFFALHLSRNSVFELPRDKSKKWIAIQLGAAQSHKIWDPQKWAQLAKYILQKHSDYGIYLLGGKDDIDRANIFLEEISKHIKPYQKDSHSLISLVGETDFDLWTSVISRCEWLMGGDTAAIHLASVLGVRVLNVSIGPVRFRETGPYGNGHYVICSNQNCNACNQESKIEKHTCAQGISPEAVYATWSYASREWAHRRQISIEEHFSRLNWEQHLAPTNIFRSKIRSSNDGGGVVFEPMAQRSLTLSEWSAMVIGQIARTWYCGWTPPVGQEINQVSLSSPLMQQLRELRSSAEVLSKICEQASRTALILNARSLALKSEKVMSLEDKTDIQDLGQALTDLEALIDRLANTHPPLMAFSHMMKVLMHHLQGELLSDLSKETSECYRQLHEGVTLLRQWIKFTLDLGKPRTLPSAIVPSLGNQLNPPGPEPILC